MYAVREHAECDSLTRIVSNEHSDHSGEGIRCGDESILTLNLVLDFAFTIGRFDAMLEPEFPAHFRIAGCNGSHDLLPPLHRFDRAMRVLPVGQPLAGRITGYVCKYEPRRVAEHLIHDPWHIFFRTMLEHV